MQVEIDRTEIESDVGGGTQLLAEWHGCNVHPASLADIAMLRDVCLEVVVKAGLTVHGNSFHTQADGGGVAGVVLLDESHVAIRTWPDRAVVVIDVFVCNCTVNYRAKAYAVVDLLRGAFIPIKENLMQVRRGGTVAGRQPLMRVGVRR